MFNYRMFGIAADGSNVDLGSALLPCDEAAMDTAEWRWDAFVFHEYGDWNSLGASRQTWAIDAPIEDVIFDALYNYEDVIDDALYN